MDELERKVGSQQEQLFLARRELTNTAAELKTRAIQAEGRRTRAHSRGARRGVGGRVGSTGNEAPPRVPPLLSPPGLAERLELEKKRSRQGSEDLERLRAREVLVSDPIRPPAVPAVCPGPAEASGWHGVPEAHPWPCSP